MYELRVGIGQVAIRIRHASSLKEKRKVTQRLISRLRNLGFSVVETTDAENPRHARIGFAYAGSGAAAVQAALDGVDSLLLGDFEVVELDKEIFDYSDDSETEARFPWEKDDDAGDDEEDDSSEKKF